MPNSAWLEHPAFPGRRHLLGLARSRRPQRGAADPADGLDHSLRQRWAAHLGVRAADLLPCASSADAWRLLCGASLGSDAVALLAEPTAVQLPAAILSAGAAYLDLGRDGGGRIDPGALTRACQLHPAALLVGESPSLFGSDDASDWGAPAAQRPRLLDARHAAAWAGEGTVPDAVQATVICLRDPDAPASPLMHAIVCQPGDGEALRAIQGPGALPLVLLEAALATLARIAAAADGELTAWQTALAATHRRFCELAHDHPGAVCFPAGGTRAAIECRAGDAAALFEPMQSAGLVVDAFGGHPMRDLLICDLAASAA